MTQPPGSAVESLPQVGRRYAILIRCAVTPATLLLGWVAASPAARTQVLVLALGFLAWTGVCVTLLQRGAEPGWVLPCDVAALAVLAFSQADTVPTAAMENGGTGWVVALVSMTMLSWQLHIGAVAAVAAVSATVAALLVGASASPTGITGGFSFSMMWISVESLLGRLLWSLVQRAARRADQAIAVAADAQAEAAVAVARRAEERAYVAMLHDTVATTLLMVGLGQVRTDAPWLSAQAERDLAALHQADAGPAAANLSQLVEAAVAAQPELSVHRANVPPVPLEATVATAVAGALREVLNNVSRHSGTRQAQLIVRLHDDRLALEITDSGRGFDPSQVAATRRGITGSIGQRIADVGGSATVHTAAGEGTRVVLEWPR